MIPITSDIAVLVRIPSEQASGENLSAPTEAADAPVFADLMSFSEDRSSEEDSVSENTRCVEPEESREELEVGALPDENLRSPGEIDSTDPGAEPMPGARQIVLSTLPQETADMFWVSEEQSVTSSQTATLLSDDPALTFGSAADTVFTGASEQTSAHVFGGKIYANALEANSEETESSLRFSQREETQPGLDYVRFSQEDRATQDLGDLEEAKISQKGIDGAQSRAAGIEAESPFQKQSQPAFEGLFTEEMSLTDEASLDVWEIRADQSEKGLSQYHSQTDRGAWNATQVAVTQTLFDGQVSALGEFSIEGTLDTPPMSERSTTAPLEQLSLPRAGHSNPAIDPRQTQSMLRQIVDAVQITSSGTVDIALSPEELGKVRLSLTGNEGQMTVVVQAERSETLDLMRRHVEQLAQDMRDLGYSDLKFSFESSSQDAGNGQQNDSFGVLDETEGEASEMSVSTKLVLRDGGLDIRL